MTTILEILKACGESFQDCFTVADLTTPDEELVYVNKAFLDLTGYKQDEVINRNCRFMQGNDVDRDPVIREKMRDSINKRECFYVDVKNFKKDRSEFWNRLALIPVSFEGEPRYYVGIQQDVTSIKKDQGISLDRIYVVNPPTQQDFIRHLKNPLVNIMNSARTLNYVSVSDPNKLVEIANEMREEISKISEYVRSLP